MNVCIQVDIKYLTDIPELPYCYAHFSFQSTTLRSEMSLQESYGSALLENSLLRMLPCVQYLRTHLAHYGVDGNAITLQTDNGAACVPTPFSSKSTRFLHTISRCGAAHRAIPPASPTYNSDVEAAHTLITRGMLVRPLLCYHDSTKTRECECMG